MSRFYGYHYLAYYCADASKPTANAVPKPMARKDEDWDKGALLIIAIVAVPVIALAAVAIILAM